MRFSGDVYTEIRDHVAFHLERLALLSLPEKENVEAESSAERVSHLTLEERVDDLASVSLLFHDPPEGVPESMEYLPPASKSWSEVMAGWTFGHTCDYDPNTDRLIDHFIRFKRESNDLMRSEGLVQVHPTHNRKIDFNLVIVFVHGLGGDSYTTWAKDTTHWPRDLLPTLECFRNARILTFGYMADGFVTTNAADYVTRLFICAENLVNDLIDNRYMGPRKRPIIFVGHSIGGLVIKSALNLASHRRSAYGDIVDSTRAIVFFSTPHPGMSQEAWKACSARRWLSKIEESNIISEPEDWSDRFAELSSDFAKLSKQIQITSFLERRLTNGIMVVPEGAARLGLHNEWLLRLDANHLDICKFVETDTNWDIVSRRLNAIVAGIEDLAEPESLPRLSTQVADDKQPGDRNRSS